MRILGIDPGSSRIGYGLIEDNGSLSLVDYGVLEIKEKTLSGKILNLAGQFEELLKKTKPDLAGIEKLYFMKNIKTGIEVAQSRGVLMLAILKNKIPVLEFDPTQVKQTVTNYGQSDKIAVAKMVKKILNVEEITGYDDASDAIAIAITASFHKRWG